MNAENSNEGMSILEKTIAIGAAVIIAGGVALYENDSYAAGNKNNSTKKSAPIKSAKKTIKNTKAKAKIKPIASPQKTIVDAKSEEFANKYKYHVTIDYDVIDASAMAFSSVNDIKDIFGADYADTISAIVGVEYEKGAIKYNRTKDSKEDEMLGSGDKVRMYFNPDGNGALTVIKTIKTGKAIDDVIEEKVAKIKLDFPYNAEQIEKIVEIAKKSEQKDMGYIVPATIIEDADLGSDTKTIVIAAPEPDSDTKTIVIAAPDQTSKVEIFTQKDLFDYVRAGYNGGQGFTGEGQFVFNKEIGLFVGGNIHRNSLSNQISKGKNEIEVVQIPVYQVTVTGGLNTDTFAICGIGSGSGTTENMNHFGNSNIFTPRVSGGLGVRVLYENAKISDSLTITPFGEWSYAGSNNEQSAGTNSTFVGSLGAVVPVNWAEWIKVAGAYATLKNSNVTAGNENSNKTDFGFYGLAEILSDTEERSFVAAGYGNGSIAAAASFLNGNAGGYLRINPSDAGKIEIGANWNNMQGLNQLKRFIFGHADKKGLSNYSGSPISAIEQIDADSIKANGEGYTFDANGKVTFTNGFFRVEVDGTTAKKFEDVEAIGGLNANYENDNGISANGAGLKFGIGYKDFGRIEFNGGLDDITSAVKNSNLRSGKAKIEYVQLFK